MPDTNITPPRPDLVLRVGFAGNRLLPEGSSGPFDEILDRILGMIARELTTVLPTAAERQTSKKIVRFYSDASPRLRLVTGLAEGADEHVAAALARLSAGVNGAAIVDPKGKRVLYTELAGILPFDSATYREGRDPAYQGKFDDRRGECAYLLELDGIYVRRTAGEDERVALRRRRAYRAQSALLLRHADIIIAAADLGAEAKAGGTMETVAAALHFELPVILIDLRAPLSGVRLIEPDQDLHSALDAPPIAQPSLEEKLAQWVLRIVADPDFKPESIEPDSPAEKNWEERHERSVQPIREYLDAANSPPLDAKNVRKPTLREQVWGHFEKRFRRLPPPGSDPKLAPFDQYRGRATSLNYHYSGLYRGAFVLNYLLAVCAVFLAALSLVVVGFIKAVHGESEAAEHTRHSWEILLLCLAVLKLVLLGLILYNTHNANGKECSDRAIDYRYLAERLRTMYYLPRLGSFQPPSAVTPKYASRHVRQSGIDWLFDAIVRSVSPACFARPGEPVLTSGPSVVPTLRVDVADELKRVEEKWLGSAHHSDHRGAGQILYHQRNADLLDRMYKTLDGCVRWLNRIVIAIVAFDIVAACCHWDPANAWIVWLIFLSGVLPAAVASLNGLRFQSECERMADRSLMMFDLLKDRSAQAAAFQQRLARESTCPIATLGSYSLEALLLAENVAQELVEEVAEWSVLYAKDVTDT